MAEVPGAAGPASAWAGSRRRWLLAALGTPACLVATSAAQAKASAPHQALQFPRDHGAHPQSLIEWWYITGALGPQVAQAGKAPSAPRFGFQLTFFRARVPAAQAMRSAFAPKQLLFAHAALTDLAQGRLHHDQRMARVSGAPEVDLAAYSETALQLRLKDWSLSDQEGQLQAHIMTPDFELVVQGHARQPVLLQGDQGWSRKGALPRYASHYYTLPHIEVQAQLRLAGRKQPLQGRAWLDHEWSDALLAPGTVGWDWIGINLHNGDALTAFQLRDAQGQTVWRGGSLRSANGTTVVFQSQDLVFGPQRRWNSPHSGANYPVHWALELHHPQLAPAYRRLQIRALLDDQELDSRRTTGTIYWEGLSALHDPDGHILGYGYLEMTGYAAPMNLP